MLSDDADAHYLVAKVFILEGEEEKARQALKRTLTLDPHHPTASIDLKKSEERSELKSASTSSIFRWKA
ncbi:MAG: hypothetical protein V1495_03360 [Pseudomonadota bacterium]